MQNRLWRIMVVIRFEPSRFPLSMAAANAVIQVLEDEMLLERANLMGNIITSRLHELEDKYELIGDIHGQRLMIGVELVKDRITKEPAREETSRFIKEGIERVVLFGELKYLGLGNIVKIKPPLVISENQVQRTLEVFEEILNELS